jgi:hypothetical protein
MIILECGYDPPHIHTYSDDWDFGGANGLDPRADIRYRPTTYRYFDARLRVIDLTQVPLCDDQAIDEFTKVAGYGPGFSPVWLQATRPDGTVETIPWLYDKATDTVAERVHGEVTIGYM